MKRYTINLFVIYLMMFAVVACQKDDDSIMPPKAKSNSNVIIKTNNRTEVLDAAGVHSVPLLAGQNIYAGTVSVELSGDNLLVTYITDDGFVLSEAHLWVGTDLSEMPQTRKGNPKVGRFPYKAEGLGGLVYYQFVIPLSNLIIEGEYCDRVFYLAAHAALNNNNGGTETGWADGNNLVDNGSWATYFSFVYSCDDDKEGPGDGCETAFAFGEYTFVDLGLTDSRWGWVIELEEYGTFYTPIYAAAGQNNINSGVEVGVLVYYYDGNKLRVSYEINPDYYMTETHLYVSNMPPVEIAPGQFGNLHDLDDVNSDEYMIEVSGYPVYIIAHAVVCNVFN